MLYNDEKNMTKRYSISFVFPMFNEKENISQTINRTGKLKEEVVLRIIGSLDEGTTELVCHPAVIGPEILKKYRFHKNGELELSALTGNAVKRLINDKKIRLLSYGEFLLNNEGKSVL
jgi:predicted glycoside hydrolase/deacetylase ChbG (UPF0249 family)